MVTKNSLNNKIISTTTQPLLIGNQDTAVSGNSFCVVSASSSATNATVRPACISANYTSTAQIASGADLDFQAPDDAGTMVEIGFLNAQTSAIAAGAVTVLSRIGIKKTSLSTYTVVLGWNNTGLTTDFVNSFLWTTGNWTPTLRGLTTSGTFVYTAQVGRYAKFGQVVYYMGYVSWSSVSGNVGNLRGGGLPFTVQAQTNAFQGVNVWADSFNWGPQFQLVVYLNPNTTDWVINSVSSAGSATSFVVPASGTIAISGVYKASS